MGWLLKIFNYQEQKRCLWWFIAAMKMKIISNIFPFILTILTLFIQWWFWPPNGWRWLWNYLHLQDGQGWEGWGGSCEQAERHKTATSLLVFRQRIIGLIVPKGWGVKVYWGKSSRTLFLPCKSENCVLSETRMVGYKEFI